MSVAPASTSALYRIVGDADLTVVELAGHWGQAERLPASSAVGDELAAMRAVRVLVDGSRLTASHPRVAAFVHELGRRLADADITLEHRDLPTSIDALMALASPTPEREASAQRSNLLARVGYRVRARIRVAGSVMTMIGHAFAETPNFATGRAQTRWRDFVELIQETGASSLPVVTIVNLLIGGVIGFVGAVQLETFGAGMYLADMVGVSVAREMAALMTAFIMAGRIGATFAAELATMQANEEIDALRMIGVSPFEFLALPRLAALTLMMPLLYLYAVGLGIAGGLVVAIIILGTPPMSFLDRLQDAVSIDHFIIGFTKSICFGVLIALASCHIGLRAGRNAAAVGRAATRTVVVCIVGIIIIDAAFALCTNALGV